MMMMMIVVVMVVIVVVKIPSSLKLRSVLSLLRVS
jgi:hypothetical protein